MAITMCSHGQDGEKGPGTSHVDQMIRISLRARVDPLQKYPADEVEQSSASYFLALAPCYYHQSSKSPGLLRDITQNRPPCQLDQSLAL
jgi:hypothetical protein